MKISAAFFALAMLVGVAVARNCDRDLNYCGFTLNKIGTVKKQRLDRMYLLTRSRKLPERDGRSV